MRGAGAAGRLARRRVLLTGADRGIGRALALGCAGEGADVIVHHLGTPEAAAEVVTLIEDSGQRAFALEADLSDRDAVEALAADAERLIGPIDVLINNAGALLRRSFLETTVLDLDSILAVDLVAPFMLCQLVARRLVDLGAPGSIINVTSVSQERAASGLVAYQTAKAATWMLTRGLALELAPFGIRVNSIAPGTTVTALNRDLLQEPGFAAGRLATIPLGRFGQPEDHVGAVVFLASDESAWITGTSLVVDGGITVR
jgi:NAD(P)-dependent dehydrogenase (short-subunit alcohol dehydrogenase family)